MQGRDSLLTNTGWRGFRVMCGEQKPVQTNSVAVSKPNETQITDTKAKMSGRRQHRNPIRDPSREKP